MSAQHELEPFRYCQEIILKIKAQATIVHLYYLYVFLYMKGSCHISQWNYFTCRSRTWEIGFQNNFRMQWWFFCLCSTKFCIKFSVSPQIKLIRSGDSFKHWISNHVFHKILNHRKQTKIALFFLTLRSLLLALDMHSTPFYHSFMFTGFIQVMVMMTVNWYQWSYI